MSRSLSIVGRFWVTPEALEAQRLDRLHIVTLCAERRQKISGQILIEENLHAG